MFVSSLRSHFFKHLSCTTTTTFCFFFSACHIHHRLTPRTCLRALFPPLSSSLTKTRTQWGLNSITATKFSTTAFSDTGSSTFPYLSVHIQCRKDVADMLSEALLCFGASSTSMDERDNYENDDEICISSTFSDCQDVDECVSHAANSIGLKETPSYKVIKGDQSDWIMKTQESFHPVEISEGLWVVPEWRIPPDLQATNIILNPGLTFGTGEHPTTKLCLLLLHSLIKGGELFLDYGTGSGVLAIAAIKIPYIVGRYSQFLEGISVSKMDDWACISGTKKRNAIAS